MKSARPLVSIGMPVYNGMKFIRRAMESLMAQDYENLEIVICDNASTDGTTEVLREFAERDGRIQLHVNDHNVGIIPNFRLAIERSHGEYFMWAAYDDLWMPGFVTAMVDRLEQNKRAVVAMSAVQRNFESGEYYDLVSHRAADPSRLSNFGVAWRLASGKLLHLFFYGLFRRTFLLEAFENFPKVKAGDRIFMIQVALAGGFEYDDRLLHIRSVSDASIQQKYANDELGRFWKDPFAFWKMLGTAMRYLLASPIVPLRRKWLVPILVTRFAAHTVYAKTFILSYAAMGRVIGPKRRRQIGDLVRRLTGRRPRGPLELNEADTK